MGHKREAVAPLIRPSQQRTPERATWRQDPGQRDRTTQAVGPGQLCMSVRRPRLTWLAHAVTSLALCEFYVAHGSPFRPARQRGRVPHTSREPVDVAQPYRFRSGQAAGAARRSSAPRQQRACVREQGGTRRSQGHRTAVALEQAHTEVAFQRLDLLRQGRTGDQEPAAARPKFSSSATATKYRSWRSSTPLTLRAVGDCTHGYHQALNLAAVMVLAAAPAAAVLRIGFPHHMRRCATWPRHDSPRWRKPPGSEQSRCLIERRAGIRLRTLPPAARERRAEPGSWPTGDRAGRCCCRAWRRAPAPRAGRPPTARLPRCR